MGGRIRPRGVGNRRRCVPALSPLEARTLQAVNGGQSVVKVHPAILPPTADGRQVLVQVAGTIVSTRDTPPHGFYFVTDEYRADQPSGPVALTPYPVASRKVGRFTLYSYGFSFAVSLQAKRSTATPDGRHYNLFVGASDNDGSDGRTVTILVPKVYPPRPLPAGHVLHARHFRRH